VTSKELTKVDKTNILGVETKNYGECAFCKDQPEVELEISWKIWSEWLHIMRKMKKLEWGAVFWVEDGKITHYAIPEQEVTSSMCEFLEELGGDGMIHSHHDMGAFHSGQDDKQERNLYKYSIVLSNTGSVSTTKFDLPCGGFGYRNVSLILHDDTGIDLSPITEKSYIVVSKKDERRGFYDGSDDGYYERFKNNHMSKKEQKRLKRLEKEKEKEGAEADSKIIEDLEVDMGTQYDVYYCSVCKREINTVMLVDLLKQYSCCPFCYAVSGYVVHKS